MIDQLVFYFVVVESFFLFLAFSFAIRERAEETASVSSSSAMFRLRAISSSSLSSSLLFGSSVPSYSISSVVAIVTVVVDCSRLFEMEDSVEIAVEAASSFSYSSFTRRNSFILWKAIYLLEITDSYE